VLNVYAKHYNSARPHRALKLRCPDPPPAPVADHTTPSRRRRSKPTGSAACYTSTHSTPDRVSAPQRLTAELPHGVVRELEENLWMIRAQAPER
jgi:hypothetical protein